MCGRYALYSKNKVFSKFNISIKKNYNISPGNKVLIIDQNMKPIEMIWGIKPEWKNDFIIINARNETINEKQIFRDSKRCFFIADGYYEWSGKKGNKNPYYLWLKGQIIYFAGLYNHSGCCIVTEKASNEISFIHRRQPVFLSYEEIDPWLRSERVVSTQKKINYHQVSRDVNKTSNNNSNLILSIN